MILHHIIVVVLVASKLVAEDSALATKKIDAESLLALLSFSQNGQYVIIDKRVATDLSACMLADVLDQLE